ncbi:hypothetical protein niasHS_013196 [Heterodera schachtii]|uniref:BPI2 domain-containing protein n=1 Tax=Heterodera schachtii TaxID=97005 RepID=A0ABD2IGT9_HETSC
MLLQPSDNTADVARQWALIFSRAQTKKASRNFQSYHSLTVCSGIMTWREWSAIRLLLRLDLLLLSIAPLFLLISLSSQDGPYRPVSHLLPHRSVRSDVPLALLPDSPIERPKEGPTQSQQQRRSTSTQKRNTPQGTAVSAKSASGGAKVARTHRSKTNERTERCSPAAGHCVPPGGGPAYHSALADGVKGYPGIKARMNPRTFQYLSDIALGVLNYQIKRARLPNINQCLPQLNGCVQVYNLYVSRYRCPQRVTVYPAPPNLIVLDVQNLDIGVTGNLGGQIVILLPLALFGIIQVNAYQLNIRVGIYLVRGPTGCPQIRVASCAASVGYVDVYIQNGGLLGDIANSQFRGKISEMVRQQIPGQICQRLPSMLDEQANPKLCSKIPQFIPVRKMLEVAISATGLGNMLGGTAQCPASCNFVKRKVVAQAAPKVNATLALPPALNGKNEKTKLDSIAQTTPVNATSAQPQNAKGVTAAKGTVNSGKTVNSRSVAATSALALSSASPRPVHPQQRRDMSHQPQLVAPLAPHAMRPVRATALATFVRSRREPLSGTEDRARSDRATVSDSGRLAFVDPGENLCANCPNTGTQDNLMSSILQSMDMSKLDNIFLDVRLLNTHATNRDYTIEVVGEFSVGGSGGTPFGAFPMQFPDYAGAKMADILISDFTINSLFYHLQSVDFLRIRMGPETPKYGELMKTTCSSEEDTGLEDHGVETEDGAAAVAVRVKRQDAGDLTSLGVCLGDILPAVREQYPNQLVYVIIHTIRAPSIILSSQNGGVALLNFLVDVDFYIQSTNQRVGTIRIASDVRITIRTNGAHVTGHADVVSMHLEDVGNQLGLPQDALDNLGTLGRDLMLKSINDKLEQGTTLNVPPGTGGIPINIVDPVPHILDHAILIESDFTMDTSQLGGSEPCEY